MKFQLLPTPCMYANHGEESTPRYSDRNNDAVFSKSQYK